MTRLVVAGCLALSVTAWAEAEALNRLSLLRVESTAQGPRWWWRPRGRRCSASSG